MTIDLTPATLNTVASALLFAGVVAVTLTGAVIAAASRRLVYCVSGLVLSFIGLAGLYVFLNSPFLALMQVLIYIGAICVTIMFALMLAAVPAAALLDEWRARLLLLAAAGRSAGTIPEFGGVLTGGRFGGGPVSTSGGGPPPAAAGVAIFPGEEGRREGGGRERGSPR